MNRILHAVLAAVLFASCASAQTTPKPPEFAVATIRPAKPDANMSRFMLPAYGLKFDNLSLQFILREAYGLQDDQIVGAPAWVKSSRFDVEARVDEADRDALAKLDGPQKLHMIQPFLEDRFKLKVHSETRQLAHYELAVGRSGPKFKETAPPPAGAKPGLNWSSGGGEVKGLSVAMATLARLLSEHVGGTVVDRTGLKGFYELALHWTPDDAAQTTSGEPSGPSLFTAIQEQLGLKLEAVKTPVQVMVIDHIELPTPD